MPKKGDLLLIAVIVIGAVLASTGFYIYKNFNKSDHLMAEIIQNNKVIERIDLNEVKESRLITVSGNYQNHIRVEPGRISFETSDCPDKICVQTGWLEKYGDIAICMPNRVIVTIENK
ncbi:MAG: NusG domain II-containing protein [Firmicutes bacterium]|nr:NusG domain II-containing protein [Bacillota bacterium]